MVVGCVLTVAVNQNVIDTGYDRFVRQPVDRLTAHVGKTAQQISERFSVAWHVFLSAVIGTGPAIILSRKVRSVWEWHYESSPAAGAVEKEEAVKRLKSENRLYTIFHLILILGIIGVPVFIRESGSLFTLLGYSVFWFMLCLMLTSFRLWDRWIAEWQICHKKYK